MYTIVVNNDNSLLTSIRTNLIRNTTTDEINFLVSKPNEEGVTYAISGYLYYRGEYGIIKTESLVTDEEDYKGRVRLTLPKGSSFFNERGSLDIWLKIFVDKTTATTDEESEETESYNYLTNMTQIVINEIPTGDSCRHDSNTIFITRGDSLTITISLVDDDGFPYEPVDGDIGYFRVKKSAIADDVLIEKTIDLDNKTIDLVEADTKSLNFGEYKYEVEIVTTTDDHYTVIKNAVFMITPELH